MDLRRFVRLAEETCRLAAFVRVTGLIAQVGGSCFPNLMPSQPVSRGCAAGGFCAAGCGGGSLGAADGGGGVGGGKAVGGDGGADADATGQLLCVRP